MRRLTRRFFCLAVLAVSLFALAACQKTMPAAPELPNLKVGVVGVVQPTGDRPADRIHPRRSRAGVSGSRDDVQ